MTVIHALKSSGEAAVFAVLALVGLAALVQGASYGVTVEGGRVGPGFLPVVAGGLTAVLCGWIAVRTATSHGAGHDGWMTPEAPPAAVLAAGGEPAAVLATTDEPDITGRTQAQRTTNLWRVFGLTFGAILLVQVVGFLAAFALLVLVISTWAERQPLVRSVAIAAISCAVVYLVFGLFLGVPLPGGLLGLGTEG